MLTPEEALQVDIAVEFHAMGARSVTQEGPTWRVITRDGQQRDLLRYSSDATAIESVISKLTAEGWVYTIRQVGPAWQASASISAVNRFGRPRPRNLPFVVGDTRAEAVALLALVQIKHSLADDLDLAPGNPSDGPVKP